MLFKRFTSKLLNVSEEARFYRIAIVGLMVLLFLSIRATNNAIGDSRTTLVPPDIKRSFWVSSNHVSQEYLEEMAYWYVGLALNVTPQASAYQRAMFLKFADPAASGKLTAEAEARDAFLAKNNVSTIFSPRMVWPDVAKKRIAIAGNLSTYVADKRAPDRNVVYVIGFTYRNGTLYVSEFRETTDQNPFGDAQELDAKHKNK